MIQKKELWKKRKNMYNDILGKKQNIYQFNVVECLIKVDADSKDDAECILGQLFAGLIGKDKQIEFLEIKYHTKNVTKIDHD